MVCVNDVYIMDFPFFRSFFLANWICYVFGFVFEEDSLNTETERGLRMFLVTFLWRKRARLTDLSFLNTISPVLCPIWDGVKLNLYLGWRGLKVRPELTAWVYGAWCGHLCSQAELDGN